ncbi:hypothetical protein [uncultured Cellulomonas sp.]|uniref:hypothetical protein n=1 Tax=uncultured Cellulomonas sp. TaxID=189682 RepID=UPI002632FE27|nr:hypothetical protein [uncultured Cellulomonas sp.]
MSPDPVPITRAGSPPRDAVDPTDAPARGWVAGWLAVAAFAVANGGLRERALVPRFGEARAQRQSTGMLIGAVWAAAVTLGTARPLPNRAWAARVGAGWAAATVAFELGLGLLRRRPLAELVAAYDVRAGRPWALVPVTMAIAPVVAGLGTRRRAA